MGRHRRESAVRDGACWCSSCPTKTQPKEMGRIRALMRHADSFLQWTYETRRDPKEYTEIDSTETRPVVFPTNFVEEKMMLTIALNAPCCLCSGKENAARFYHCPPCHCVRPQQRPRCGHTTLILADIGVGAVASPFLTLRCCRK